LIVIIVLLGILFRPRRGQRLSNFRYVDPIGVID
jgi:hypothetical protein